MSRTVLSVRNGAFWDAVRAGLSAAEAAVSVGVSGHTGRRWFTQAGGVMPRVSKPKTDGPRPRLTVEERVEIQVGVGRDESIRSMAKRLGRAPSTIKRELDVNARYRADGRGSGYRRKEAFGARQSGNSSTVRYDALSAHDAAARRALRPKERRLAMSDSLHEAVQTRLQQRHSPTQISVRLRREFPDNPEMWMSAEAIYQSIYVQGKGALRRDLHQCLRSGRAVRRPQRQQGARRTRIRDMINISERPAEVNDRAVPGHWEGDLILGAGCTSAIGTLVERSTRFVLLLHLPADHGALAVQNAIVAKIVELPTHLRRSLTWDQGIEMANHAAITKAVELDIYFCDPHSPWQRGTNENTNGLLRQYFPKGTDLRGYTAHYLDFVAAELNGRPRKTLDWRTPAEALDELLSQPPPVA